MVLGPGTPQRPNFDGFIYIHHAAPSYSARISAIYLVRFNKVWLGSVCRVQRLATKQNGELRRVGENSGPIFTRLWTKFSDEVGDPSYFSTPLSDFLCRVSFRRYSPLSLEVFEKPNKWRNFGPQFFGRDDPDFSTADCQCDLLSTFGNVWLSSVCWSASAKPGNELECRIYIWWVITKIQL